MLWGGSRKKRAKKKDTEPGENEAAAAAPTAKTQLRLITLKSAAGLSLTDTSPASIIIEKARLSSLQ